MKIEPRSKVDENRLVATLGEVCTPDAEVAYEIDPESSEIILLGHSELALDHFIERLIHVHGIPVNSGHPQVAYRETVARSARVIHTARGTPMGPGFARIELQLEPRPLGAGNTFEAAFESEPTVDAIIAAIARGVNACLDAGLLIGFPVTDTAVTLLDFEYVEDDVSTASFEQAARHAMSDAAGEAGITVLEPIMLLEIAVPKANLGAVMGLVNRLRGSVSDCINDGESYDIKALVPAANTFGLSSWLRQIDPQLPVPLLRYSHHAALPRIPPSGPDDFSPAAARHA